MFASKNITPEPKDYRALGIDIIYSARDTKGATPSPPSKSWNIEKASFPSPPEVLEPKLMHISKTSRVETSSFQPKTRSYPREGGESKVKKDPVHCCNSCRATFATVGDMNLHQARSHNTSDLTEISFSKPVVSFPSLPAASVAGKLHKEDTNEQTSNEFVPRGQGKLWEPPISTRPKNWNSTPTREPQQHNPKRKSRQRPRRGRRAPDTKEKKEESQEEAAF